MLLASVNITKRERRRKLISGTVVTLIRWVINYREPRTGKRRQLFFERARDAQVKRNEIVAEIGSGTYSPARNAVTVAEAMKRWLANRAGEVKAGTLQGYEHYIGYVVGPLLVGTKSDRSEFTRSGKRPVEA